MGEMYLVKTVEWHTPSPAKFTGRKEDESTSEMMSSELVVDWLGVRQRSRITSASSFDNTSQLFQTFPSSAQTFIIRRPQLHRSGLERKQ